MAARYVRLNVNSGWGQLGQFGLSEVRFYYLPVNQLEPETPWQNSGMWIGLALGVVAIALSFVDMASLRWVALFDSVGFGMVAWIILKYLTDREKVNIHKVRIESIKRRSSEVRREMAEFSLKVVTAREVATSS